MDDMSKDLREILAIDVTDHSVRSRENSRLEYKESFNLGSAPRYLRTMAAFANAKGGFLVFGVTNSPRTAVGIDRARFDNLDPVRLTMLLNSNLSPEIEWDFGLIEIADVDLGWIHTSESRLKPVIATSNYGGELKEGEVYYRYRGQSRTVGFPELRSIIDQRLEQERAAWRRHFESIAAAGPTSVGILDKANGVLTGAAGSYLVDEALLQELTFVQEGHFDEVAGDPTLKLIGTIQPVSSVQPRVAVPIPIHFDEIINSFLGNRGMPAADGRAFLEQAYREDSYYQPFHFFRRKAGMTVDEALELLDRVHIPESRRTKIKERIDGTSTVAPIGSLANPLPPPCQRGELLATIKKRGGTARAARSQITRALATDPSVVGDELSTVETHRVLEAITQLAPQHLRANADAIRSILSSIFLDTFYDLSSPHRTYFRKAVARLDEVLFRDDAADG